MLYCFSDSITEQTVLLYIVLSYMDGLKQKYCIQCIKCTSIYTAYKGLVRPILEYCSPVWDPYPIKKYTNNIEKVQRCTARFMFNRYHNMSSPTDMIRQLEWESLEQRGRKARLIMFYKIQHGLVAVPLPPIVTRALKPRPGYPHQYIKQTTTGLTDTKTVFSHLQ